MTDDRPDSAVSDLWREARVRIRTGDTVRLKSRWFFPVAGPPIADGVLEIVGGRIASVEPLAGRSCPDAVDLGNSALLPSLVNAHAHLEFSDLAEPIPPPAPFADWIRNLMAHRRNRPATRSEAILSAEGAEESARSGTVVVGDIVTGGWTVEAASRPGPKIVAFRELIGLRSDQEPAQLRMARQHMHECREAGLAPGLSPHAPFSVSPSLFHSLVDLAEAEHVPLCFHLAETKAELELLAYGTGELVDMLKSFGLWQSHLIPRGTRPLQYLMALADLPAASIAHGNYLSDEEMTFLGSHPNITTIYCPRTHHFFGHDPHPWQRLLAAGARVALGTDGRSSNPDYSLWSELQFLDRATGGTARPQLLRMATQDGAAALGLAPLGTLTVGNAVAPTLVELGEDSTSDPWQLLFHPDSQPSPYVF